MILGKIFFRLGDTPDSFGTIILIKARTKPVKILINLFSAILSKNFIKSPINNQIHNQVVFAEETRQNH